LPARGGEEFGDQIEAGRLAGPIRPDQRMDRSAPDFQVHIVNGDEAFELFGEPIRANYEALCH
jgi:hypothetical protein